MHDNFFALGGDSIINLQIIARANQQGLETHAPPALRKPHHRRHRPGAGRRCQPGVAQDIADGYELPLAAGQLARLQQGPLHATWRCVALTQAIDSELLSQAIGALQQHHQALRLALKALPEGEWQQRVLVGTKAPVITTEKLETCAPAQLQALAQAGADALDLDAGQTLHASLLEVGGKHALLLAAHPLCLTSLLVAAAD